jgi:hypothetical protein
MSGRDPVPPGRRIGTMSPAGDRPADSDRRFAPSWLSSGAEPPAPERRRRTEDLRQHDGAGQGRKGIETTQTASAGAAPLPFRPCRGGGWPP